MAKVWREEAELPGVALSRPPLREAEPLRQQEELRSDGGLQEKAWVAGKCWAGFGVTAPGETPGRAQATGPQPGTWGLVEPPAPPPQRLSSSPFPSSPSCGQPTLPHSLWHFGPLDGKSWASTLCVWPPAPSWARGPETECRSAWLGPQARAPAWGWTALGRNSAKMQWVQCWLRRPHSNPHGLQGDAPPGRGPSAAGAWAQGAPSTARAPRALSPGCLVLSLAPAHGASGRTPPLPLLPVAGRRGKPGAAGGTGEWGTGWGPPTEGG